jgi:hypothetical protein
MILATLKRGNNKSMLIVISSLMLLVIFVTILAYHDLSQGLYASAQLPSNAANVTGSNGTSTPGNASTIAGSRHIYRGGAPAGTGGE